MNLARVSEYLHALITVTPALEKASHDALNRAVTAL